jgi:hypothetical protein
MNPSVLATVAAFASALSAAASLVGVWYNRRTAIRQADATDFNNCVGTVRQLAGAQRLVRDAPEVHREFEFRELLNLMEALALLINDQKVPPSTLRTIDSFLEEAWAHLQADSQMIKLMEDSLTGENTYVELRKFAKPRKRKIEALIKRYQDAQQRERAHGELPLRDATPPTGPIYRDHERVPSE